MKQKNKQGNMLNKKVLALKRDLAGNDEILQNQTCLAKILKSRSLRQVKMRLSMVDGLQNKKLGLRIYGKKIITRTKIH